MGTSEVCAAHSTTSEPHVPLDPGNFDKRLVLLGMLFHKVNAQCYDYDMYNMLYICLFPYRFKNWGFKSFIRETKGPSSTSASW